MPITQFAPDPAPAAELESPAPRFPFAEQELCDWFRRRQRREASSLESGVLWRRWRLKNGCRIRTHQPTLMSTACLLRKENIELMPVIPRSEPARE